MATYDAHVADSQTTITKTLTVAGAALGSLVGATFSVKVTNPSGVVESWTAGFTGGAAGLVTFVTPTDAYWDEVGTWRWDVRYTLGAVSQTCDPILLNVGPSGYVPTAGGPGAAVSYDYPAADAYDIVHLYVDEGSASADDDNLGDSSSPLLTAQEALNRLERWVLWGRDQEFAIHLSDNTYSENLRLKLPVPPRRRVSIVGDDTNQTVLASGTATAGSAVTLTNSGASWGTAHQYAGYVMRIKRAGTTIANPTIKEHTATVATFCESNPQYTFASGDTYEILRPITIINSLGVVLPWQSARVRGLGFQEPSEPFPLLQLAHLTIGPGVVNEVNMNAALLLEGGETAMMGCRVVGSTTAQDFTPYGIRLTGGACLTAGLLFGTGTDRLFSVTGGTYVFNGCGVRCDTGTVGLHIDDGSFAGVIVCKDTGIRVGSPEGLTATGTIQGSVGAHLDFRAGAVHDAGIQCYSGFTSLGADTAIRLRGTTGTTAGVKVYGGARVMCLSIVVGAMSRDIFWVEGGRLHIRASSMTIDGAVANYGVACYFGGLVRVAASAVVSGVGNLAGQLHCETTALGTFAGIAAAPIVGANGGSRIFQGEYEP